jgi:DNA-binding transcriptional MerR regulator
MENNLPQEQLFTGNERTIRFLCTPLLHAREMGVSYRTINHYLEKGIISKQKDSKKNNWKQFTPIEFIWIQIVISCRNFGVSINNLCKLKSKIFEENKLGFVDRSGFINPSFVEIVAQAMHGNRNISIEIFYDFTYTFSDLTKQRTVSGYFLEPHLHLPLKDSIEKVILYRLQS